jgi:hypothetical protein
LINRKEEIKKKGFSMEIDNSNHNYSYNPVDFSKMNVGAKILDDAIFTAVGDLKKVDRRLADKETVLRAIQSGDFATMREISNFFYKTIKIT